MKEPNFDSIVTSPLPGYPVNRGSVPGGDMYFLFSSAQTYPFAHYPSKLVPSALSWGIKWPELEAHNLPPSNADCTCFLGLLHNEPFNSS